MSPGSTLGTLGDSEEEQAPVEAQTPKKPKKQQESEKARPQEAMEEEEEEASATVVDAAANAATMNQLRQSGELFEDAAFPAEAAAISFDADEEFEWLRPKQIDSDAQFIKQGFSRDDVSQGELGNCWILASLAGLAERPEMIADVVLPRQSMRRDYCGAFRFRLWRFGSQVDVIVDDRLPTRRGLPVFAQPINGEFWVCLLEKALAKLYGCYEALEAGLIFEALADMTGGVCEEICLPDEADCTTEDLPDYLSKCFAKSCIVGASSVRGPTGDDTEMGNGLVYSHAYTVTGATTLQVKGGSGNGRWRSVGLVRARNPWGTAEWQGKWSDHYGGWSDEQRRSLGLVARDDGEFWMELGDFVLHFHSVVVLHRPLGEWRGVDFRGEWAAGSSAGGQPYYVDSHHTNPQFVVDLADSPTDSDDTAVCLVSLEEPDQRHRRPSDRQYAPKAVFMYEADGCDRVGRRDRPVADSCPFNPSRTHVHTFRLRPGRYILLPCTYEPNQEAQFLLRVFTEAC